MSEKSGNQVYNVIAFIFADRNSAMTVSNEIKHSAKSENYKVLANAVVEVDEKGKAHVHEAGHGGWGTAIGAGGLGMLSLIGGPAGLLVWAVAGGVIGGEVGKHMGRAIPKEDMEKLGAQMQPNTSAILAVIEDTESEQLIDSMKGYHAQVVTLTMGDEVSGEIAEGVEADVTGPADAGAPAATAPAATAPAAAATAAPATPPASAAKN